MTALSLASPIISLYICISKAVTLLLAPLWGGGQIYGSTEGDVAELSSNVSGPGVGIFITASLNHVLAFDGVSGVSSSPGKRGTHQATSSMADGEKRDLFTMNKLETPPNAPLCQQQQLGMENTSK